MKKLLVVAVVSMVAVAGYRLRGSATADKSLAQDRVWIDHVPRGERDVVNIFVLLTEHPGGGFQQTSAWKGSYELFRYELNANEARLQYPQTGDRESVKLRATRCNEAKMDFCLEIDGASRGVKRYYSRKGWEIKSRDDADAIVHGLY